MSMSGDAETDINEVFDTILLSEDKIISEAYREGLDKGRRDGELDGYHAGYHRGAELGAEIGFYRGVVNAISSNKDENRNERVGQLLEKMRASLDGFPKTNNYDVNIQTVLDDVRAQYRKLCAVMKLNLPYPTCSKMSF